MLAAKLCGIVKLLRHIIYDIYKVDVEISGPIKIYAPDLCVHQKIGPQTLRLLTIWARQNLQPLTSSKSGCRPFISPLSSETAAVVAALPPQVQKLLEEFPSPPLPSHSTA